MNQEQTVFVVDDEPIVARALVRLLRSKSYTTQAFGSAREFMDYCKPGLGGCALVDFSMPEISGLELQQELARLGIMIPIVFLTGFDNLTSKNRAIMTKLAVGILQKPVEAEILIATIEKALARDREVRGFPPHQTREAESLEAG